VVGMQCFYKGLIIKQEIWFNQLNKLQGLFFY